MISYLIRSIILTGVAYGVYIGLLKKEKIFVFNRFYLLLSLVIGLLYPAYHFIPENNLPSIETEALKTISINGDFVEEKVTGEVIAIIDNSSTYWQIVSLSVYFSITLALLIKYIWSLSSLWGMIRTKQVEKTRGLRIVYSDKICSPHTFLHYLFVNPKLPVSDSIMMHEMVHSRQWHSLDILFVELVKCIFWFNPFAYLYKKAISENHEYLADHQVSKAGVNIDNYITSILSSIIQLETPNSLSSGFSYLQTKNRIKMLQINKSSNSKMFSKLTAAVTVFSLIVFATSFAFKPAVDKQFNVVIDIGHGGKDPGAAHGKVFEKELTYEVANRLKEIASSSSINIILTREGDDYISLQDRAAKVKQINPDLLISLHSNWSASSTQNGVEAYILEQGKHFDVSKKYAQLLIKEQLTNGFNKGEIKQNKKLFILRESNCPSVLLELGFLSNESDRQILTSSDAYDKLAQGLFNSISEISTL